MTQESSGNMIKPMADRGGPSLADEGAYKRA